MNLYSKEFTTAKSRDLLSIDCPNCLKIFYKTKHHIQIAINSRKYDNKLICCSVICGIQFKNKNKSSILACEQCGTQFKKIASEIKNTNHHFCGSSCAATYSNTHKTKGTRVSKLEVWLSSIVSTIYPNLEFHFNRKDAINSELDVYIPSLKLAFELNGIFHYEPIYGVDKLSYIQNNDNRKFQACIENGISLCVIDTSGQKRFTEHSSQKFLDIIKNIIDENLKALHQ